MAERLGVEERFDMEIRIVGYEQAALDARLLDAAELRQRRGKDRTRRRAIGRLVAEGRDGVLVPTSRIFRLALGPIVPSGRAWIQSEGMCDACKCVQRPTFHDKQVTPEAVSMGVVG